MTFVSFGADRPTIEVSWDITNDPSGTARTWTDITPYVRGLSILRGRQTELGACEPGKLTLALGNNDRRFDPTYASGPYYPNVKPMRRIRVRATWATVIYNLFAGYVDGAPQEWNDYPDAVVELSATDAFKVVNLADLDGKSYSGQRSDIRVGTVLYDCGIGTADYNLSVGQSTIVASGTLATGVSALSHVQDVMASENGVLFVNGGGTITGQDRHYRVKNVTTSSGTIGNVAGEIPFRNPTVPYGDDTIFNRWVVTPSAGTAEQALDSSSTAAYYTRTGTRSILVSAQTEALAAAQYLVSRFKDPQLTMNSCELVGAAGTATWATILGLEISSRLTWKIRPSAGGTISQDGFVEQVGHQVTAGGEWVTPVKISPVDNQTYWVLGNAANGLLGSTTKLGY